MNRARAGRPSRDQAVCCRVEIITFCTIFHVPCTFRQESMSVNTLGGVTMALATPSSASSQQMRADDAQSVRKGLATVVSD
jgi:hypothetical protein